MKKTFYLFLIVLIGNSSFAQVVPNLQGFDSLEQKLRYAKEDTNQVRTLLRLGSKYSMNALDSALIYMEKSLTLAEKINDEIGIARSQNNICAVLTRMGNFTMALEYGFKGLAGFEKLKDTIYIVNNLNQLSMCFREQGDNKNAIKFGIKSLKLIELYGANLSRIKSPATKRLIARVGGILSSAYEKNNQLDLALKYGEPAFQVRKDWSGILYVLGNTYLKKRQHDKALHHYKMGLLEAIKANFQKDKLEILTGISNVYIKTGVLDSAIIYSKQVLIDKYGRFYPSSLLVASAQLAAIYESSKQADSAFKYLKKTVALKDTLFNQGKTIAFQNLIFKEDQKKKELEAAELTYQNRLKIYGLLSGFVGLMLIAFFLWRSNQHKQKANALLHRQKQEIDLQRNKAEDALSELKSTQNQLIQKEKLASLGELTAGIAHEIQNPLNFVNNFSELSGELLEELKSPLTPDGKIRQGEKIDMTLIDDLSQNLSKINHHGQRASSIVKGMLEHSRTSTGEKELVDINALSDEYLRLSYHGLRAKNPAFNADYQLITGKNLPKLEVIPQEIGRVFLNLINNAFYAAFESKKPNPLVTVTTELIPSLEGKGWVKITVKDNGKGIQKANLDKIFQPFFTTKPTGEGTGLGLSLAYDIITKGHGGTLEVESVEGEGSTFIILLPISK